MKNSLRKPFAIMASVLLVILLLVSTAYADIDSRLVGKWMFDRNVNDSSGYGNNGTIRYDSDDPAVVDGVHQQAYSFDRSEHQYVEIPDSPYLNFGTGSFTISCWFRVSHCFQYMTLVDKRYMNGYPSVGYRLYLTYGEVCFTMVDTSGASSGYHYSRQLYDDTWHNVIVIVNRSGATNNIKIYIDGDRPVLDLNDPVTGSLTNNGLFHIGGYYSECFNGAIDEVMVYRQAISEDEAHEIYMNGINYFETLWNYRSCVGKWNMEGNAMDLSGNTNNGTLHGTTLPEIVDGVHDWALSFNGTNYISVPSHPTLDLGTSPRGPFGQFTISFWVKTNSQNYLNTIIDKRTIDDEGYKGYLVALYNGRPLLQIADGPNWYNFYPDTTTPCFNDGHWHFVVFTVDRRIHDLDFYVYGKNELGETVVNTYSFDSGAVLGELTNTSELYIGRNVSGECFVGTLDDVKFYNKFLYRTNTDEQFRAHSNNCDFATGTGTGTLEVIKPK